MLREGELAPVVAAIHPADLRHGDVALVGEDDGVVGDELEEGGRRLARRAAREVARVVLDPVAGARGLDHLDVEMGALLEPLGLQQLALAHELVEPLLELLPDLDDGLLERRARRDVVRVGVDPHPLHVAGLLAGERVELGDRLQIRAEERQPPGAVLEVGGVDLDRVAAHAERAPREGLVVAAILLRHEVGHDLALVVLAARMEILGHRPVGLHRADAVDARHRGHDDDVVALQQSPGCRVAHPVDLLVDLRFLLDVGVAARDVGLRLVVVVVAHEVLDRVVGEETLELPVELGRERLVRRQDDRGALRLLDDLGHGEGLARARGAEQHLVALAANDALGQLGDRGGLVARGLEVGRHAEADAALELLARAHGLGGRPHEGLDHLVMGDVVGHGRSLFVPH